MALVNVFLYFFVSSLVFCTISGQVASLCRPDERFLSCGGCQLTCRQPTQACLTVCRVGCYCAHGLVRNDTGHCVNLADCPRNLAAYKEDTSEPRFSKCPDNEEYRFCEPCNKTCDNPNPICPAQCARGCFCKGNLVRDSDGVCKKYENCGHSNPEPPLYHIRPIPYQLICGPRQVYKECVNCEKTCSNPNPICTAQCTKGCVCEDGYVKAPNSKCVKLEHCPKGGRSPIPYHKEDPFVQRILSLISTSAMGLFNPYDSDSIVPAIHDQAAISAVQYDNIPKPPPLKYKAEVTIGGREPSIEDCSPDEEYLSCGWCEASCSEPTPQCPVGVCTRGCLCKPPLLRHYSGHCVEEKECLPQKCLDPKEEYICRYGCEARCDKRACTERLRRCALGCHCVLGTLRDTATGHCVPPHQCSNVNTTIDAHTLV